MMRFVPCPVVEEFSYKPSGVVCSWTFVEFITSASYEVYDINVFLWMLSSMDWEYLIIIFINYLINYFCNYDFECYYCKKAMIGITSTKWVAGVFYIWTAFPKANSRISCFIIWTTFTAAFCFVRFTYNNSWWSREIFT